MSYPDPELLVATWLDAHLDQTTKVWADPRLPDNWPFTAPLVHVQRAPGAGDAQLTLDTALLDIDVYAKRADHARDVAEQVRGLIRLTLPYTTFSNGVFVTGTITVSAPSWAPDPTVARRTAAYQVTLHGVI